MMKGAVRFLRLHCRVLYCTGFGFVRLHYCRALRPHSISVSYVHMYIHTYTYTDIRTGRHTTKSDLCASLSILHDTKLKLTERANGWRALTN